MTTKKLENCPFCGCSDIARCSEHDEEVGAQWFFVRCTQCCSHSGYYQSREAADRAWNRRAPSATETELRELISAALEVMPTPPDRNCSCHISPPCSDCTEWDGLREWFERAKAALAKGTNQ